MKLRDIYANYHKYTYAQLLKEFPGIDWTMMFWVSGCPSFDEIVVQQHEPIPTARRSTASRLSERISETMADCMWHCVPYTMIRALQATSTDFQATNVSSSVGLVYGQATTVRNILTCC